MYFNSAEKGITPGDTWHARRVLRGDHSVWGLSGLGPLGELPGGALGARPRGTRGGLGSIRGGLPAGVLGDRCFARRASG